MARAKHGIDMTRQSSDESKNLVLRPDINKTIYRPVVGKIGMIYYVALETLTYDKHILLSIPRVITSIQIINLILILLCQFYYYQSRVYIFKGYFFKKSFFF